MRNVKSLLYDTLENLVREWKYHSQIEQIACDEDKITLLMEIRDYLGTDYDVCDVVRNYYREVFLRDAWARQKHSN
jgi:hypothetical protein